MPSQSSHFRLGCVLRASKSSELRSEPRPGAPVIDVRCDVFCGAVNVRRPEPGMR